MNVCFRWSAKTGVSNSRSPLETVANEFVFSSLVVYMCVCVCVCVSVCVRDYVPAHIYLYIMVVCFGHVIRQFSCMFIEIPSEF